jgi:hypothetical protein
MAGTKKTFALLGGAVAVAFAVGFGGGLGVDSMTHTPAPATQPAASVVQQPAGVHVATLTSCIAGLGC